MSVTAIIPARSNSKRLPNKNFLKIQSKSLVELAVQFGLQLPFVDKIIVLGDGGMPSWLDKKLRVPRVSNLKRPKHLMDDEYTIANLLAHYELDDWYASTSDFLILNCNVPFRDVRMFQHFHHLYQMSPSSGFFTVSPVANSRISIALNRDGLIVADDHGVDLFDGNTRSQSQINLFAPNAFFHIISKEEFRRNKRLFAQNMQCRSISKNLVIDIDTMKDYLFAIKMRRVMRDLFAVEKETLGIDSGI